MEQGSTPPPRRGPQPPAARLDLAQPHPPATPPPQHRIRIQSNAVAPATSLPDLSTGPPRRKPVNPDLLLSSPQSRTPIPSSARPASSPYTQSRSTASLAPSSAHHAVVPHGIVSSPSPRPASSSVHSTPRSKTRKATMLGKEGFAWVSQVLAGTSQRTADLMFRRTHQEEKSQRSPWAWAMKDNNSQASLFSSGSFQLDHVASRHSDEYEYLSEGEREFIETHYPSTGNPIEEDFRAIYYGKLNDLKRQVYHLEMRLDHKNKETECVYKELKSVRQELGEKVKNLEEENDEVKGENERLAKEEQALRKTLIWKEETEGRWKVRGKMLEKKLQELGHEVSEEDSIIEEPSTEPTSPEGEDKIFSMVEAMSVSTLRQALTKQLRASREQVGWMTKFVERTKLRESILAQKRRDELLQITLMLYERACDRDGESVKVSESEETLSGEMRVEGILRGLPQKDDECMSDRVERARKIARYLREDRMKKEKGRVKVTFADEEEHIEET